MVYGIGIGLIEIDRIQALYSKQPELVERILTKSEQHKFNNFTHGQRKIEFLAGRFATKEAFSKALGINLGEHVAFSDIDCYNDELGKPRIDYEKFIVHTSISHTEHYAMNQVILEKSVF